MLKYTQTLTKYVPNLNTGGLLKDGCSGILHFTEYVIKFGKEYQNMEERWMQGSTETTNLVKCFHNNMHVSSKIL